jgi:hypothetical protein
MIAVLLLTSAHGGDDPPERSPAQRATRAGTIEIVAGSAAIVGGAGLMFVGRGEAGQISEESNAWHDMRSIGGSILVIGGAATLAIGIDSLSRASRLRKQETSAPQAHVMPWIAPGGGGVAFDLTF